MAWSRRAQVLVKRRAPRSRCAPRWRNALRSRRVVVCCKVVAHRAHRASERAERVVASSTDTSSALSRRAQARPTSVRRSRPMWLRRAQVRRALAYARRAAITSYTTVQSGEVAVSLYFLYIFFHRTSAPPHRFGPPRVGVRGAKTRPVGSFWSFWPKPPFWSFWPAISEPGWTRRKKVPFAVLLKLT